MLRGPTVSGLGRLPLAATDAVSSVARRSVASASVPGNKRAGSAEAPAGRASVGGSLWSSKLRSIYKTDQSLAGGAAGKL